MMAFIFIPLQQILIITSHIKLGLFMQETIGTVRVVASKVASRMASGEASS